MALPTVLTLHMKDMGYHQCNLQNTFFCSNVGSAMPAKLGLPLPDKLLISG